MNYATMICSNISLTIVMQRISKKRKTRTFFGHGYALTYDNCCIAYSCGSSERKELLSEISRKFRGVSCPEFHYHDEATSQGCNIGYVQILNDVQILKCEWI